MKKIMLHGATSGTNFGDFIFASIFYKKIKEINPKGENLFYEFYKFGLSDFFKSELRYDKSSSIKDVFNSDLLVFISGGYFGERDGTSKENLIRFLRYVMVGILFKIQKKPIAIVGIGGGPLNNRFLRKSMCKLMSYSSLVTVRDNETAEYFKAYGAKGEITITSDTAQVISSSMLPELDLEVQKEINFLFQNKKIIFFHVNSLGKSNSIFNDEFINALNSFLENHKDYGVIVGSDEAIDILSHEHTFREKINTDLLYIYDYKNPWQLCSLLNEVNLIITPKLHVGIVGSTLSKSVISFPIHAEKTKRYYKQIGEDGRCVPFNSTNQEIIEKQLIEYHQKEISLNKTIIESANQNMELLEELVISMRSKR